MMPFTRPLAVAWLGLNLALGLPCQAAPEAGTSVANRAMMYYTDVPTGEGASLGSNEVKTIVQPHVTASLSASSAVRLAPGMQAVWTHRLTNTGNVTSRFVLLVENEPTNQFDLTQVRIIQDLNGNGLPDTGEPGLNDVTLTPGQSVDMVVIARSPMQSSAQRQAWVQLKAATNNGNTLAQTSNQATTTLGPVLTLAATGSATALSPGQMVNLSVVVANSGGDASGLPISMDGTVWQHTLVNWPVPPGTQLVDAVAPGNATLLYHRIGTAANSYTSTPPNDLAEVDAVAYAFSAFPSGTSSLLSMRARITTNGGTVASQAQASYRDGANSTGLAAASNQVVVRVVSSVASLRYYTSNQYSRTASAMAMGASLHLQADAMACNHDTLVADTLTLRITSSATGDTETFTASETGPDTGLFRTNALPATAPVVQNPAISGNGRLETQGNDQLVATVEGCSTTIDSATVLVDPFGVVFDSQSNVPVGGVTVELIDVSGAGNGGQPGAAARVWLSDGVTPAPASVVTSADGAYRFPLVAPSSYRLRITTPTSFSFPSRITGNAVPMSRVLDPAGSYGGTFIIAQDSPPIQLDVPVDPIQTTGLMVQKSSSRTVAEIGDVIDYQVLVRNLSGVALQDVLLTDHLPRGLRYLPGTTRRDGTPFNDPQGNPGPGLVFDPVALPHGSTTRLTYRVRVEASARVGDVINQAQVMSTQPLAQRSNVAQAKVRIEGGAFSMKGFVVGRVFADCRANGLRDANEPGVPGVRIWLEDGSYAITDGQGQFSLAGLRPGTHVAKLDPATLPPGLLALALDARQAGDGDSRFIDMRGGELIRADFALGPCTDHLAAALAERHAKLDATQASTSPGSSALTLSNELTLDSAPPVADPRSQAASGVLPHLPRLTLPTSHAETPAAPAPRSPSPWRLSHTLTLAPAAAPVRFGIVWPRDGQTLTNRQTRVRIHVPQGTQTTLSVNGIPVDERQLGERTEQSLAQTSTREYVGITLQAGDNTVQLVQHDPFGNQRATDLIHVQAPGDLARLDAQASPPQPQADGQPVTQITVHLTDAKGLPVHERQPLTLDSHLGTWLTPDLNPNEAGVQVFAEGGQATWALRGPAQPGVDRVSIQAGRVHTTLDVAFTAQLRDMVAVGIVEGVLNLRQLSRGAWRPSSAQDGFARDMQDMAGLPGDGRSAGRLALFLKGKIRGDHLLTLGYDSDKNTRERLFRDIQPDQFYPIYGDASIKGYDAQSTGKLYVRIDKNRSWLLHGDFTTPPASPSRKLAAYARSLSGVRHHLALDQLTLDTFATRDRTRQIVEDLPGNGTSGPYLLAHQDLIANSGRVELIVRDRNQPGRVISSTPQTRFQDYEIEPFTGRILFRTPVPSLDADLNPVVIRITYEIDQGGRSFWVMGGELQAQWSENLSWGINQVRDLDPQDPFTLSGLNLSWQDGPLTVVTELARSHTLSLGAGQAQRVDAQYKGQALQWQVSVAQSDEAFDNPSSLLSRGRSEAVARMSYTLNEQTRVLAEAIHTHDERTGEQRDGAQLVLERSVGAGMKFEMGLRSVHQHTDNSTEPQDTEVNSLRSKLSMPVPHVANATVFAEAEQAIGDESRRMAAIGGDYRLSDKGRLYGRYEFISSLSGPYELNSNDKRNTAVIGMDGEYMSDGRAFSEYRVRDAFEGRETEAAIGLKNRWRLAEGLRLNTSFERVQALSQASARNESTAVTGAIDYTANPDWKGSTRLEYRVNPSSHNILGTAGLAMRLDDSWTAMVREIINLVYSRVPSDGDRWQQRTQLGLAWRDIGDVWTALARYEWKAEQDDTPATSFARSAHVVATHVNMKASRAWMLSGRYAIKWGRDRTQDIDSSSVNQLLSGRALYDINERWDMGFQASTLFTSGGSALHGMGGEVGYRVKTNLWFSLGHNVLGFKESDLADEHHTERGTYLRLRFKFDEKLLEGF